MTHASGNPAWQDWPSRTTPVTAAALENLEAAVDARGWIPSTSYGAGAVVRDPYGFPVKRITGGTSGASYNATEAAKWAEVTGVVSAVRFGFVGDGTTDDYAAIQAALNTGGDVVISKLGGSAGLAKISATLVMYAGAQQKVVTHNVSLAPSFVGDGLVVTSGKQRADVVFTGALQPAGDYTNVAAIRIGGTGSAYNPQSASVAGSYIGGGWKGNGIIWDQGALIDFTDVYITGVGGDGIQCTAAFDDNNHGLFSNTHVVSATGRGYSILGDNTVATTNRSRHHVFSGAKAFGCGMNFYIESFSNHGAIFSENGVSADTLTASSSGNNLQVIGTQTAFENFVDSGAGNIVAGYSSYSFWESKTVLARSLQVNAHFAGVNKITQTADNTFQDTVTGVPTANVSKVYANAGTGVRVEDFRAVTMRLPGSNGTSFSNTRRGQVTVPASTTIAAGATFAISAGATGMGVTWTGFASAYTGTTTTQTVTISTQIKSGSGDGVVIIKNESASTIDISGWVVVSFWFSN